MAEDKNIAGQAAEEELNASQKSDSAPGGEEQPLPVVTFSAFVLSIASSALVHLGEVPDPDSGEVRSNLDVAKHNIDILSMLKDKSAGNLDADEQRLIDGVLYELRLKYVMADK